VDVVSNTSNKNFKAVSIYCQFLVLAYRFVYAGKMTINTKLDEKLGGADNL